MPKIVCPTCKCEFVPMDLITSPRLMAQALDTMANEFEQGNERLIKLNAELEDRVLQRTRQLKSLAHERQRALEEVSAQLKECQSQLFEKDKQITELTNLMK